MIHNQSVIKANQGRIIANQRKLDQVLRNQKRIEANQGKISRIRPSYWPGKRTAARAARLFVRAISIRLAIGPTRNSA